MRFNYRIILPVFVLTSVIFSCVYAEIYRPEAENISNRDYFSATLDAISNAKESIVMAMYIISLQPGKEGGGVRELLEELVKAKKRGVTVKVILEYHSPVDLTPEGLNYYAYRYLKDNDVDVYFDESSTNCLHLKTIVIDKEIVITGSSNWSEAAFRSSYETNLMLRSKELAMSILGDLEEIPVKKEFVKDIKNAFNIPCSFLSSRLGALRKMVFFNDERAFNIILLLWSELRPSMEERDKNAVSCDFIAEKLGLTKGMTREDWRRQIKKVFRKLERRYSLIRYAWGFGEDNINVELLSWPGENPLKFPRDYFEYGWDTRLGLCAKAVLVTMYAELKEVPDNVTSMPIIYLSKKYGMRDYSYSKGIGELRRFNIIKVKYGKKYGKGYENREKTRITILGVYDMRIYEKEVSKLKARYGEELVGEARDLAGIVFSAYDIGVVEDILKQIKFYGIGAVREAFSYVKRMSIDNYKRTYNYVLAILRSRRG